MENSAVCLLWDKTFGLTPLRAEEGYGAFTEIYYKRVWRYASMSIPKIV